MHNGFYTELDELRKDYPDSDFGFMQNTDKGVYDDHGRLLNAYDFLHGFCDTFAQILHTKYGYPVYMITNGEDHGCIHCFCKYECNNKVYYVDVRGITDNYDEFIAEFEDWTDKETSLVNTVKVTRNTNVFESKVLCEFAALLIEDAIYNYKQQ